MITACKARSIRRRRSSRDGKNDPDRSLRICTCTSPGRGGQCFGSVPVAVGGALRTALIRAGAEGGGQLGFDQLLQACTQQFGDHRLRVGGLELIEVGEYGRMVVGHRVCVLL